MTAKPLDKMTDAEVLAAAGDNGPDVIGKELFARAQKIRRRNPGGEFGPDILRDEPAKPAKERPARPARVVKGGVGTTSDSAPLTNASTSSGPVDGQAGGKPVHPATPKATAARKTPAKKSAAKKK